MDNKEKHERATKTYLIRTAKIDKIQGGSQREGFGEKEIQNAL